MNRESLRVRSRYLLGNILLYIIVVFSWGNVVTRYLLKYVYHPITFIAATLPPPKFVQNPAGSITEVTRLMLIVTYRFLDICTHISIGAIIGKLFAKQKTDNLSIKKINRPAA